MRITRPETKVACIVHCTVCCEGSRSNCTVATKKKHWVNLHLTHRGLAIFYLFWPAMKGLQRHVVNWCKWRNCPSSILFAHCTSMWRTFYHWKLGLILPWRRSGRTGVITITITLRVLKELCYLTDVVWQDLSLGHDVKLIKRNQSDMLVQS